MHCFKHLRDPSNPLSLTCQGVNEALKNNKLMLSEIIQKSIIQIFCLEWLTALKTLEQAVVQYVLCVCVRFLCLLGVCNSVRVLACV